MFDATDPDVSIICLDFEKIYNKKEEEMLEYAKKFEDIQSRILQVKEVGYYDLLKDTMISHETNSFDLNTLTHVRVYESYFKTLGDVLGPLQKIGTIDPLTQEPYL